MTTESWLVALLCSLSLSIPGGLAYAALTVRQTAPLEQAERAAYVAAGLALVVVLGSTLLGCLVPGSTSGGLGVAHLVRLDVSTRVMLALVCTIAVIIVRYSRSYLSGDHGQHRYARALLATLATVSLLVMSNNLLVIALAWTGTSFALHRLLTFYGDRRPAQLAAHKKFLVSRLADLSIFGALGSIGLTVGSLNLDRVAAWVAHRGQLPALLQVAAVLLVLGTVLRSAQLPFHGWLMQVMEAPTPVSALLHAGVVNIGGFVMIRLAPLMAHAALAQTLLVVIGMSTTVIAALVMTLRVSTKVALAWSTSAQLGFMLVQCGLGLWNLALLHLVAHSLYKAHSFLTASSAVETWRAQALGAARRPPTLGHKLVACGAAALIAFAASSLISHWGGAERADLTLAPLTVLLGLGLVDLITPAVARGARQFAWASGTGAAVALLYFGAHSAFLPTLRTSVAPLSSRWLVALAGFAVLFCAQTLLQCRPESQVAIDLQLRLRAGLYLDEWFTRLSFRFWPPPFETSVSPAPSESFKAWKVPS